MRSFSILVDHDGRFNVTDHDGTTDNAFDDLFDAEEHLDWLIGLHRDATEKHGWTDNAEAA